MIYTLDARNSVQLQAIQSYFSMTYADMHREINNMYLCLLDELARNKIDYKSLRPTLVPQKKEREVVIVTDSLQTDENWYSYYVFQHLLKAFDKESVFSVLQGNYINTREDYYEFLLKSKMEDQLGFPLPDYRNSSQYYLVYLNNITDQREKQIREVLKEMKGFVGIADVTFISPFKDYISSILSPAFIKYKNLILTDGGQEYGEDSDVNDLGFPFEEHGFEIRNLYHDLYDIFLSYKIERQCYNAIDPADQLMGLASISPVVGYLDTIPVEIPPAKLDYLLTAKKDTMKRVGLDELEVDDLEELIKEKLTSNYIYELDFLEEYQVAKFNIMLELGYEEKRYKIVVGLKYSAVENKVSLITLF